jgi:uncharacterized membrane protein
MGLNVLMLLIWGINLAFRWSSFRWQSRVATSPLVLSAVGTVMLAVSAYLGSRMVFDQGVGVARMSKGKWRKLAQAGRSNMAAESGGGSQ